MLFLYLKWIQVSIAVFLCLKKVINILKINKKIKEERGKRKMKRTHKQNGITLVALVITIVILLILAGISIQAITNQGLFGRANEAKRESEIASIKEQIALDVYEKQLVPPLGSITDEQLETILGKYGTVNKEDGTIVTPVNDITTWLKTGEIKNSKYYLSYRLYCSSTLFNYGEFGYPIVSIQFYGRS